MQSIKVYQDMTFDEERALYGSNGVQLINCRVEGPADGESFLKESKNIRVESCHFSLRYPFWHDDHLVIENSAMTETCRAAIWYSQDVTINGSRLHGIKALRECTDVTIKNCDIQSPEFGWSVKRLNLRDSRVEGEYLLLRSKAVRFQNVKMKGKYSFQYIKNSEFENCYFDTKDAFWHAKNVVVKDCIIKGEYLAWYSENIIFDHCTIIGTQPLCYCKGLVMKDCKMQDADLAFERSMIADATILTKVDSIKNPRSGFLRVKDVGEVILTDPLAKAEIQIESSK